MSAKKSSTVRQELSSAVGLAGREVEEKKSEKTGKYYVYAHRYLSGSRKGNIFYIGKGKGQRKDKVSGRNAHWKSIVAKYGFYSDVLFMSDDEDHCLKIEKCIIKRLGIENLANKASGGRKNSGWKHSEEWKIKASAMRSGENNPNFGKSPSQAQRIAISKSLTGRPSPKKGMVGVKLTEAQRARMKALHSYKDERNPWLNFYKMTEDKKKKLSTPVSTVCGMKFYGMNDAVRWLKNNGWPKASHSAISLCCKEDSNIKMAYGYIWRKENDSRQ